MSVFTNPRFITEVTHRVVGGDYDSMGIWQPTSADTRIDAVVQPVNATRTPLPEGVRLEAQRMFFVAADQLASVNDRDVLVHSGVEYIVADWREWPTHYEIRAARRDPQ